MNNDNTPSVLDQILVRTEAFEAAVLPHISSQPFLHTSRSKLTTVLLGLAHEHWVAQRGLRHAGLFHPAIALLRLQFEATLKAFWIGHAATDRWVSQMSTVSLRESDGRVREPKLPSIGELVKDIERTAPPRAAALLSLFKSIAWHELNSFVHGGVLALSNLVAPMPELFLVQMLKNANGVWELASMLMASQLDDDQRILAVAAAQLAYPDCLPERGTP